MTCRHRELHARFELRALAPAITGLLLLIPGAAWAQTDAPEPVGWWLLEGGALREVGNDEVRTARTYDEAAAIFATAPAGLPGIDFDAYLLIVVPGSGNAEAKFDVESVAYDGKEFVVRAVREMNADGNEALLYASLAIVVRKRDGGASAAWADGAIADMRARRDCPEKGGHIATMDIGVCTRCGKDTPSGAAKLCLACARDLTCCPFCLKRVEAPAPPK